MTDIKQATRDLADALAEGSNVICIHYSCENFNDVVDRPAAVSAIGVAPFTDPSGEHQADVFSIANSAENDDRDAREKDMFQRFFEFARNQTDAHWVHWNMNNATYGFNALIARYRYLLEKEPPAVFRSERLYDLDSIVGARYGEAFVPHPKLPNLCRMNKMFMTLFSTGVEEASAFADGNFGLCERSAGHKAHLLASILQKFTSGTLQTANSVGVVEFAGEHLDAVRAIIETGQRFLYVQRSLAKRHGNRPTIEVSDEYDAQDLLKALLAVFFDDIRPEEFSPSYAGANSRIDFVLPEVHLAIELKHSRASMDAASLGAELLVDRERYEGHVHAQHLICLVFDHDGHLANPRGLESDLSRTSSTSDFPVTVKIYDR
jgi:hypothetical protein